MKNICLFYIAILIKKLQDTATCSFVVGLHQVLYRSTDTIFYNFLELYSTLSETKIFVVKSNFPFLNRFTQPQSSPSQHDKGLLSMLKDFKFFNHSTAFLAVNFWWIPSCSLTNQTINQSLFANNKLYCISSIPVLARIL